MASFGKVLDLLDDRYLNLQDVTGNVEPMPTLVPYEQYGRNVLVYRMDTEHDILMGLLQDFTMRRANEIDHELWTWWVQWEVDSLMSSMPSPKKARLRLEQPETVPSAQPQKRKGPAYTTFERRVLDPELIQEEDMLRILIDIVQINSSIVPNFIEFMYRWIDFYEGDGKALKAALRHEIPSLWEFDDHPRILPAELKKKREEIEMKTRKEKESKAIRGDEQTTTNAPSNSKSEELMQGSPTKKLLEMPDIAAMERQVEESERLKYREVKYGIKPPMVRVPFPPLVNIPPDGYQRKRYYAACFKSRQHALSLLVEAGITIPQIANYKKLQKEHPKDTPQIGDGDGLQFYEKDAEYTQFAYKQKLQDIARKDKALAASMQERLIIEALSIARSVRPEMPSRPSLVPPAPSAPTPNHLHAPSNAFAALIKNIAASKNKVKGKIGRVPTPLMKKMKSKVFDGAFDSHTLKAMMVRTAFEDYPAQDHSTSDIEMLDGSDSELDSEEDEDSGSSSEDDDDDDDDTAQPPGGNVAVGANVLPLPSLPSSFSQGFRLPPLAPPPELIEVPNRRQQLNGTPQTHAPSHGSTFNVGAAGNPNVFQTSMMQYSQSSGSGQTAHGLPNQGSGAGTQGQQHRRTPLNMDGRNIIAGASSIHSTQAILPSSATVSGLPSLFRPLIVSAVPAQPNQPMRLPPLPPPPPGFSSLGQTNQPTNQAQQIQPGWTNNLSSSSNPGFRPSSSSVLGPPPLNPFQQTQGTLQQQQNSLPLRQQSRPLSFLSSLTLLAPPSGSIGNQLTPQRNQNGGIMPGLQSAGIGPSQSSSLPSRSVPGSLAGYLAFQQGYGAQAGTQMADQSTDQTLSTPQAQFTGMNSFTFSAPSQPTLPPHGMSTSSNSHSPTLPVPGSSMLHLDTARLMGPRVGITRNAPSPLELHPATPLSPLSSLAPHLLATSPFAVHARPIPIQIYFPAIVVPGSLRGPGGLALGNSGVHESDAILVGHCVPGSGKIVLSKAIFLPTGVWTNMLRRVQKDAYKVLETYAVPDGHPAKYVLGMTTTTTTGIRTGMGMSAVASTRQPATPHKAVYEKLVQAYSIMARSLSRETELTKRWRTTPGPMTQLHRGAVWEGWGVTLEQEIEMNAEQRKGAMLFSALVNEGVDRKVAAFGLAEDQEEAERRAQEIDEYLDRLDAGLLDEDEYMED